jgi:hypothetical protein
MSEVNLKLVEYEKSPEGYRETYEELRQPLIRKQLIYMQLCLATTRPD